MIGALIKTAIGAALVVGTVKAMKDPEDISGKPKDGAHRAVEGIVLGASVAMVFFNLRKVVRGE